jgi:hypothetical protein
MPKKRDKVRLFRFGDIHPYPPTAHIASRLCLPDSPRLARSLPGTRARLRSLHVRVRVCVCVCACVAVCLSVCLSVCVSACLALSVHGRL